MGYVIRGSFPRGVQCTPPFPSKTKTERVINVLKLKIALAAKVFTSQQFWVAHRVEGGRLPLRPTYGRIFQNREKTYGVSPVFFSISREKIRVALFGPWGMSSGVVFQGESNAHLCFLLRPKLEELLTL
jgi:hypothetical protein